MQTSAITCFAILSQLSTLVAAAPPLTLPSSKSSPPTSLLLTAPNPQNLTATPILGRNPPQTPFYWSSPKNTQIVVKFTHTLSTIHRQPEYVAKALEDSYFETLYHLGPQGGGAATRLEVPFDWPGAPAGAVQSTDLNLTPGSRLTWSIWSSVLAGLYSFSLKYEGFDCYAEIEWKNSPGISLGDVSFVSRG